MLTSAIMPLAFLQNLGMPEMIVIGLVALLLFGRRLPEVGRSLGKGIVEFKKGLREAEDEIKTEIHRDVAPPAQRQLPESTGQPVAPFNDPAHVANPSVGNSPSNTH